MKLKQKDRKALIARALEARQQAYAPYSNYPVGAAVLAETGEIYQGANIENAAYPVSMCAERVAIFKAISQGERRFQALAVAARNGGAPCGACRQVMSEFGLDTLVLVSDEKGKIVDEATVGELLPNAFRPSHLESA